MSIDTLVLGSLGPQPFLSALLAGHADGRCFCVSVIIPNWIALSVLSLNTRGPRQRVSFVCGLHLLLSLTDSFEFQDWLMFMKPPGGRESAEFWCFTKITFSTPIQIWGWWGDFVLCWICVDLDPDSVHRSSADDQTHNCFPKHAEMTNGEVYKSAFISTSCSGLTQSLRY